MFDINLKKLCALALVLILLPGMAATGAFAEDAPVCCCAINCAAAPNADCALCSDGGSCAGRLVYPACEHHSHDESCGGYENACGYVCGSCCEAVQALLLSLPSARDINASNKQQVADILNAIDDVKSKLSAAAVAAIDFSAYTQAATALQKGDNWFGFSLSKSYLNGIVGPVPSFSFLDANGVPAVLYYGDMSGSSYAVSPAAEGLAGFYYLPAGTYTVSEMVEGDWEMSVTVDGIPAENGTFTGEAGQNYDITVINTFRPGVVSITPALNGSVSIAEDTGYFEEGVTVTLLVSPDPGYVLESLSVKGDEELALTPGENGSFSFVMPYENATVSAVFALCPHTDGFSASGNVISLACDACGQSGSITLNAADALYSGSAYSLAYTESTGFLSASACALAYEGRGETVYGLSAAAPVNAGEYSAVLTYGEGEAALSVSAGFEIAPMPITAEMLSIGSGGYTGGVHTGAASSLAVTVNGSALISGTDYDVTLPSEEIKNAGDYAFTVIGKGNFCGEAQISYTVAPAPLGIVGADIADVSYNESGLYELTVEAVEFEGLMGDDVLVMGADFSATAVLTGENGLDTVSAAQVSVLLSNGNYTLLSDTFDGSVAILGHAHDWSFSADGMSVTARCANTDGNCSATEQSVTLTVPEDSVYSGEATSVAAVTGGIEDVAHTLLYTGESYSSSDAPVNAGEYTVTLSAGGLSVSGSFTVSPKNIENCDLSLDKAEFVYTGSAPELSVIAVDNGVGSYTMEQDKDYSLTPGGIDAGAHKLTVSGCGNYTGSVELEYVITPAPVRIVGADSLSKTYDGSSASAASPVFSEALPEGVTLRFEADFVSADGSAVSKAGEGYSLMFHGLALEGESAANYTLCDEKGQPVGLVLIPGASIARRPVTITAQNRSIVYGSNERGLAYRVDGSTPLVKGETLRGALRREPGSDAGEYTILQGAVTNENNPNYLISFVPGVYTIEKCPLEFAVSGSFTKVYDGTVTAAVLPENISVIGLPKDFTADMSAVTAEYADPNAGENKALKLNYSALVILDKASANASANFILPETVEATASITPAPLTVTPDAGQGKTYGDAEPVLSFAVSGVPAAGSEHGIILGRDEGENVGEYAFLLDESSLSTNYTVTLASDSPVFTVAPYALTDVNTTLAIENREWTGETLSGFVGAVLKTAVNSQTELIPGRDFDVTGHEASDIGSYSLELSGKGNFTGTLGASWKLTAPAIIKDVLSGELNASNATLDHLPELERLRDALASVDENTVGTAVEKQDWANAAIYLEPIFEALSGISGRVNSETIESVKNVTADNVRASDREALEKARTEIEGILGENLPALGTNTEAALRERLAEIDAALALLDAAAALIADIENWLNASESRLSPDNEALKDEYSALVERISALGENGAAVVNAAVGQRMEQARLKLYTYLITYGAGQSWTRGTKGLDGLAFTANGSYDDFLGITIDGKALNTRNYTSRSGSTVVLLKSSYLNALKPGTHYIQFVYRDGSSNIGEFYIFSTSAPRTGDDNAPMLWLGLMLLSLAAIPVLVAPLRRKPR